MYSIVTIFTVQLACILAGAACVISVWRGQTRE